MNNNLKLGLALAAIAITIPFAANIVRDQMISLTDKGTSKAQTQLKAKGCTDLGQITVKSTTISLDPIGPGPFTSTPTTSTIHRFTCPDGSTHDLPAR